MAEKKVNNDPNEELVPYALEFNPDPMAEPQQFYSYNFKNYLIKPGVTVMIPLGLKRIIEAQNEAKMEAVKYIRENELREPSNTSI